MPDYPVYQGIFLKTLNFDIEILASTPRKAFYTSLESLKTVLKVSNCPGTP